MDRVTRMSYMYMLMKRMSYMYMLMIRMSYMYILITPGGAGLCGEIYQAI